ncbi:hypothetical protein QUF58_12210 [Anaerolineales bacterium HSG24]|nr:hypothetical protein [Anaerolineales bacterium HSG24]
MTNSNRQQQLARQSRCIIARLDTLKQLSNRYAWARLVIFLVAVVVLLLALYLGVGWLGGLMIVALFSGLFSLTVAYHRRVKRSVKRHTAYLDLQTSQIARLALDWPNIPYFSNRQPDYQHAFEIDLDLLGPQSLHHLLDTTVSFEAGQLLANWLTALQPNPDEITRRQALVQELTPRFLFRNRLLLSAVVAGHGRKMWGAQGLMAWLEQVVSLDSLRFWLQITSGMAVLNLILFSLDQLGILPFWWQITFIFYLGVIMAKAALTGHVFNEAIRVQETLHQLTAIFEQLTRFSYQQTPHLQQLCAPFFTPTQRPADHFGQLTRTLFLVGLRGNPITWLLFNSIVPWDLFVAYRLEQQKQRMATQAETWLTGWFELEALSALANFAHLHPDYTMPHLLKSLPDDGSVFQATAIGHPLIAAPEKICNDYTINKLGDISLITGSNMAGKSTFLRTVGLNLALTYAGGPVNATRLQTIPFRLFTCIKVSDSVTSRVSYFYAEVKRLKQLLSTLQTEADTPLFFFIDEIFRGTNNRERRIGSWAYIEALVGNNGVGLISTHDLELTKLAEQFAQVENYHFRDDVQTDQMVFDYLLRDGPCPTTNALKLMRLEGLPILPIEDEG